MKKSLSVLIICVILFALCSCAKASDLVVISGISETVWLGDTLDLTGTYEGDDGRYFYEWSSSDEKVATITSKTDGVEVLYSDAVFSTVSRGKTDLTLKIYTRGKSKSPLYKKITVKVITEEDLPDAIGMTVESENITLKLGEEKNIAPAPYPAENIFKSKVAYHSNNPDIVSVNEKGVIVAKALGETEVIMSYGSEETTVSVKVLDVPESLEILINGKKVSDSATLNLNETLPLSYRCVPKDTGLKYLVFTADNKLALAKDGVISALLPGDTTLTVVCTEYPALIKTVNISVVDPNEEEIKYEENLIEEDE